MNYKNGTGTTPRLPDRVVDSLINSADVTYYRPLDGRQLGNLHDLVHAAAEELLARLPAPTQPSTDNGAAHIESFFAAGATYHHVIFCSDDDRVELQDDDCKPILTFTSRGIVHDELSGQIGSFHMRGDDHHWEYAKLGHDNLIFGKDLLKAEVEVSKLYLSTSETCQPPHEPVAYIADDGTLYYATDMAAKYRVGRPLYARAQQHRAPLTDGEIVSAVVSSGCHGRIALTHTNNDGVEVPTDVAKCFVHELSILASRPQQPCAPLADTQIEELALANGFKLKLQPDETMALNPYVFDFARALLAAAKEPTWAA